MSENTVTITSEQHEKLLACEALVAATDHITTGFPETPHPMLGFEISRSRKWNRQTKKPEVMPGDELAAILEDPNEEDEAAILADEAAARALVVHERNTNLWVHLGDCDLASYDEMRAAPHFQGLHPEVMQALGCTLEPGTGTADKPAVWNQTAEPRMDIILVRAVPHANGATTTLPNGQEVKVTRPTSIRWDLWNLRRRLGAKDALMKDSPIWQPYKGLGKCHFMGYTGQVVRVKRDSTTRKLGIVFGRMPNPDYKAPEYTGTGPRPLGRAKHINWEGPRGFIVVMQLSVFDIVLGAYFNLMQLLDGFIPQESSVSEEDTGEDENTGDSAAAGNGEHGQSAAEPPSDEASDRPTRLDGSVAKLAEVAQLHNEAHPANPA